MEEGKNPLPEGYRAWTLQFSEGRPLLGARCGELWEPEEETLTDPETGEEISGVFVGRRGLREIEDPLERKRAFDPGGRGWHLFEKLGEVKRRFPEAHLYGSIRGYGLSRSGDISAGELKGKS